ncbi:hypothetical protein M5D96_012649 [Drosophila gunungcola]|uniref:Uncharacterized protein n=1 Tax=Drosophila gunungcola TaxID=103775 RepID=A0A9Q0BK55_9MUSC|nr:hypothetical protein M5D96_012649 [Drosophila gunungcola]
MNGIGNEIARGDSLVTRDKELPSRVSAPRISSPAQPNLSGAEILSMNGPAERMNEPNTIHCNPTTTTTTTATVSHSEQWNISF